MFSPLEYVPLSVLDHRVKMEFNPRLFESVRRFYYHWGSQNGGDDIPEWKDITLFSKLTVQDFVEFRILESIEDQSYLCSPTGTILKFDLRSLRQRIEYFELSYSELQKAIAHHSGPAMPANFKRLFNFVLSTSAEALAEAKAKNVPFVSFGEETGYDYFHQQVPFFYERSGYTISLSAINFVRELQAKCEGSLPQINLAEFEDAIRLITPFEGWAICVLEDYVSTEWVQKLLTERGDIIKKRSALGRPPVRKEATSTAYKILFPNGHGSIPWLEVLRRVNKQTGLDVSVFTLRRAVEEEQKS